MPWPLDPWCQTSSWERNLATVRGPVKTPFRGLELPSDRVIRVVGCAQWWEGLGSWLNPLPVCATNMGMIMMMHSSRIHRGRPDHGAGPSASVVSADACFPVQARRAPRVPALPVTRGQGTRGREPSPSGAATPSRRSRPPGRVGRDPAPPPRSAIDLPPRDPP
jgi:hypothetical protein